jgi:hypothetical protein
MLFYVVLHYCTLLYCCVVVLLCCCVVLLYLDIKMQKMPEFSEIVLTELNLYVVIVPVRE